MSGESHNPKKNEDWLVRIIAIPIGILIGGIGIIAIGVGMPVLFFGSVLQIYSRFMRDGTLDLYSLAFFGFAIATGYVSAWYWKSFLQMVKEQLQLFKQWLNRKKQ